MRPLSIVSAALLASTLIACTDDPAPTDDETYDCEKETRDDEFSLGLAKTGTGGTLEFKLMTADPAPPAKGDNTWMVQISSMTGGAAFAGGTLMIEPFMPDHQHGSPIKATTTDMGGGMYEIKRINMWMPGLWETTIQASAGATTDAAVFRFCIPN